MGSLQILLRDRNENKIYPDLYYAIPAIVSLIVELLRPV